MMFVKWAKGLSQRKNGLRARRWLSMSGHLQPLLTTCILSSYPHGGRGGSSPESCSLDNKHIPVHNCVRIVQNRVGSGNCSNGKLERGWARSCRIVHYQSSVSGYEDSTCSCRARVQFVGCRIKRQKFRALLPKVTYMSQFWAGI